MKGTLRDSYLYLRVFPDVFLSEANSSTPFVVVVVVFSATKDRLSTENEELKKKSQSYQDEKEGLNQQVVELEMRLKVLSSQFEGKVARLEKELVASKKEKETSEKAANHEKKESEKNQQWQQR